MNPNLATLLTESAAKFPERTAIRLDDIAIPYAALDQTSKLVAGLLEAKGVEAGDRVGIMLPNVPHFPFVYFGVLRMGARVVPMNVLLTAREVKHYLSNSGAKLVVVWEDFAPAAKEAADELGVELVTINPTNVGELIQGIEPYEGVAEVAEDDTAVILYTSGTTGQPKGAELTHANIRSNIEGIKRLFDPNETDVFFGGLPLFHVFGQTVAMNGAFSAGAELTLLPRFDPAKALEIIQRDKVTIFMGVPTMYAAMLQVPDRERYDISSLRLCVSGGAALPVEIIRAFESEFDTPILEGYGLSETSPVASFGRVDMERKPGTIGTPIDGVEMRIVDEEGKVLGVGDVGELQIKGPNVMKGYWQMPEATEKAIDADGWFATGDMATVDSDGYYSIVDRKKEMILRGGYNVYPREVEEVLYEHPAVAEAAVMGVPHDELGEEIVAIISFKEGESATEDELRAHAKQGVAAYKYPRHIVIVDELPKGPTGKILKREIDLSQFGA
ncbi:MAG: long-chain fatty acid--CoA ligase [Solirubrobacterales bacterium]|nr:long-chain fatty acid--CoA ligase [Solirubrobacterales bacterium]